MTEFISFTPAAALIARVFLSPSPADVLSWNRKKTLLLVKSLRRNRVSAQATSFPCGSTPVSHGWLQHHLWYFGKAEFKSSGSKMSLALVNKEKVWREIGVFIKHGQKKRRKCWEWLDAFHSASSMIPNLKATLHLCHLTVPLSLCLCSY